MKIDNHLVTGLVLGVVAGLHFTAQLAPYTTLFLIVAIIMGLRYLRVVK